MEEPKDPTESQLMSSTVINKMLVFAEDVMINDKNSRNLIEILIIYKG